MVQAKPKSRKKPKPPGLRPLGDRVIIEREEALTETPGGIAVPDTAAEAPRRGIVLAVGPGKRSPVDNEENPVAVSVGETVVFTPYTESMMIDGRELVLAREDDLIAVVER